MSTLETDASNCSIPLGAPIAALAPPLPSTTRGEPTIISGIGGRFNKDRPVILYPAGKLVVVRELSAEHGFESITPAKTVDNPEGKAPVRAFVYRGHNATVTSAKFSPSGRYIASVDVRGKLRVWAYDHEEHLCKLELQVLPGIARDVAWDGDNQRICVAGDAQSGLTKCVQFPTGVQCGPMGGHTKRSVTIDMREKRPFRIMSGSEDQKCVFYSGPPFKIDKTCMEHSNTVNCVRFSNNSNFIASVGSDKKVIIYDGKTGDVVNVFEAVHKGSIYACAWSDDDSKLLTCSADMTAKLINVIDGSIIKSWNLSEDAARAYPGKGGMVVGCAFCMNRPVVLGVNGHMSILDETTNVFSRPLSGHQAPITALAVDKLNKNYYTSDTDGVICKWETTSDGILNASRIKGGESHMITGAVHGGTIKGLSVLKNQLISCGWDDFYRISDPVEENCHTAVKLSSQPTMSTSSENFVVILCLHEIIIVDKNGEIISVIENLPYSPLCGSVLCDETRLSVGGDDMKIHIYSISNGMLSEERVVTGHTKPISAISFSPNGSYLASGDTKDVVVWNVSDWTTACKGRWCFHTSTITCLAWSPDSRILASAGQDENVFLWCLDKKMRRVRYEYVHRGGVSSIEFLDNDNLLSVGGDGCVCKWFVGNDIAEKFD